MIKQIRIENLRSIKDSGFISMKPINILVGRNSSGKSTFLRSFPLLSQSVKKDLRGPISWIDDSFVDFGDYETARNKYVENNECIQFTFDFDKLQVKRYNGLGVRSYFGQSSIQQCVIGLGSDSKGTYTRKISIKIDGENIEMCIDKRDAFVNIIVDGKNFLDYKIKLKWNFNTSRGILPAFEDNNTISNSVSLLKNMCSKQLTVEDRLYSLFNRIGNKEQLLKRIKSTDIKSLRKKVESWTKDTEEFLEVYYNWYVVILSNIMRKINEDLFLFYSECSYIAPTRAEANRFYRNQGLQVSDVDAYGKNLQEFISSLPKNENDRYVAFVKDILNVKVSVENRFNHLSIMLENENGKFNIADVGFGYSQILPIITKLWFATEVRKRAPYVTISEFNYFFNKFVIDAATCKTILIEQPELHLHPAMQAKITDAFIKTYEQCKEAEINVQLFVETHSQALINRLGRRIAEGQIDKDDVNVLIFEKDSENRNTIVTKAEFKENGQIKNWPSGFFDPDTF